MSHCPSCQSELKDDFGLVDCAQCGAALFIEMDGTVRRRDGGGEVEVPTAPAEAPIAEDPPLDFEFAEAPEPVPMDPLPELVQAEPEPVQGPQLMQDLTSFGNSTASSARDGIYFYDLEISGIDSVDLRQNVQDALTDPLFLWDAEALVRTLELGQLKISKMSAVKASIVVQRLTGLPLQIKWVQHALYEA